MHTYARPTRREFLIGAGSLLLLAGCGGGAGSGKETSGASQTIKHRYGSTEISGSPKRVLSLGFQEHDAIFALGVTPIAVRYWYGDKDDVIYPWAEDEAGGADPEILNMPFGELNFEKIAGDSSSGRSAASGWTFSKPTSSSGTSSRSPLGDGLPCRRTRS